MKYDGNFFDYVDAGAFSSARALLPLVHDVFRPATVLDVGCGRGGWLKVWKEAGATEIIGIDGDYLDQSTLHIERRQFIVGNLDKSFDLGRKFDLVQSLEVAEHLNPESSEAFVENLVRHADVVLFSAAVVGQGGTAHINERPLEFWRQLFAKHGYEAFDFVRPQLKANSRVEPWYRYNTLVYVAKKAQAGLPTVFLATRVPEGHPVGEPGSLSWKLRRGIVRHLPEKVSSRIAALNARVRDYSTRLRAR